MELFEATAFSALRRMLGVDPTYTAWSAPSLPAMDRLRRALSESDSRASPADVIALLRQVLLFENFHRGAGAPIAKYEVMHPKLHDFGNWEAFGMHARRAGDGWHLSAEPWKPAWLDLAGVDGVDVRAAAEVRFRPVERVVEPDPFLRPLGAETYRSHAQRAAVRAALRTPVGGTLLVTLATGEGKSLILQAVASAGFPPASTADQGAGVTLVVVPTVALASDQENAARQRGIVDALAYRAGDAEQNRELRARIREGSQRLCFASPEAVCGPLRSDLIECARRGSLRALAIDEAHLVDAWGTGFRTEFQLLGGLRRELLAQAPVSQGLRTILLSATVTETSRATLRSLFSGPGEFAELDAVRLRPEPEYWSARPASEPERTRRVLEAIHHLPRPLILYVTKVVDAERWGGLLRTHRFNRHRVVHGKTSLRSRDLVLEEWRAGKIDIVVATSAFGVGIDYPHVRSVVHACLPESLDRFYQEVGRGGRDGRACISIVLPSNEDRKTAQRISDVTVIGIERGLQRWRSMFEQASRDARTDTFAVRLDVAPGYDESDIDMVGERSIDWNARTIMLLERAGMVQLQGMESSAGNDPPRQVLRILEQEHMSEDVWKTRIGPLRRSIAIANLRGLAMMEQFLRLPGCANDHFVELYGPGRVSKACGACSACRRKPELRVEPTVVGGRFPWTASLAASPAALDLLGHDGRLTVFYSSKDRGARWQRRLGEVLNALGREGFLNLFLLGDVGSLQETLHPLLSRLPWFIAAGKTLSPGLLPPGPEVVVAGADFSLSKLNLSSRSKGQERVLIVPSETCMPDRPDLLLADHHDGRTMPFDELHRRLIQ